MTKEEIMLAVKADIVKNQYRTITSDVLIHIIEIVVNGLTSETSSDTTTPDEETPENSNGDSSNGTVTDDTIID